MIRKISQQQLSWICLSTLLLAGCMSAVSGTFATTQNLHSLSRNASFYALMGIGQSWVLFTGGIDLSVGSVMGASAMVTAITLHAGFSLGSAVIAGLTTALVFGLLNALLIARYRLSPFVVTLATLSIARSISLVVSSNQMLYEFGPDEDIFLSIGSSSFLGISTISWITIGFTLCSVLVINFSQLGRHLLAIGGNESACFRQGVSVRLVKTYAYCFSALSAGLAGILSVSWLGSANSGLGTGYELPVIAAAVLGGIRLSGGYGVSWSPLIGALLIEMIRNSLLLLGVDAFWQGSVVGLVLVGAIAVERMFNVNDSGER